MFSLNLKQTVHAYTRETSVLDLFFVSQTFFDGVLSVEAEISDHRLLFFCCVSPVICGMCPVKMIKDCTLADDNAIIDSLQSQLDNPCSDDLHSLWQHFKNTVQYNIEHFVPLRKVRINCRNSWISRQIIQMKSKVKCCRRKKYLVRNSSRF